MSCTSAIFNVESSTWIVDLGVNSMKSSTFLGTFDKARFFWWKYSSVASAMLRKASCLFLLWTDFQYSFNVASSVQCLSSTNEHCSPKERLNAAHEHIRKYQIRLHRASARAHSQSLSLLNPVFRLLDARHWPLHFVVVRCRCCWLFDLDSAFCSAVLVVF